MKPTFKYERFLWPRKMLTSSRGLRPRLGRAHIRGKRWLPDLEIERELWCRGFEIVIGVDEVGRGAIAGPVVASAVALVPDSHSDYRSSPPRAGENYSHSILNFSLCSKNIIKHNSFFWERLGIDDSKRLTAKRREELAKIIKKMALAYGIGETGVGTINSIGIKKATERAMRRAIKNLFKDYSNKLRDPSISLGMTRENYFILVDGYQVKYLPGGLKNQMAIVKGDQKSISVAAASIIAKVYRDHKMRLLDKKYPHHQFGQHKGYGTKKHKDAILKFGETSYHRQHFLTTFLR